jgi:hypothetical protein
LLDSVAGDRIAVDVIQLNAGMADTIRANARHLRRSRECASRRDPREAIS